MARMKIKKMILEQFKGVVKAEYEFFDKTVISGLNGSGKTTIADAYLWLFYDKDYSLRSNPEVHPDNMEESEPSVTIIVDIDGKEVSFRKFQKDRRTKKQKEEGVPVSITNKYEVNTVPKAQKDFLFILEEYGITVDTLLLSHPEIFTGQKSADCRKILFGMVSDITDKEIADSMESCEELGALLENYSIEEVLSIKKRDHKNAEQNLDTIPEQIIGMEKAKVNIDTSEYEKKKADMEAEIAKWESDIEALNIPSVGELNQQLVLLEKEERNLVAEANSERVAKLTELTATIGDLSLKLRHMQSDRERFVDAIDDAMHRKKSLEEEYNRLSYEYQDAKNSEFNISDKVCPTCGQSLPVHQIDQAAKRFAEERQRRMDDANRRASEIKNKDYPELKKNISESEEAIKNVDARIVDVSGQIEKLTAERMKYETVINVTGTPKHQEIIKKIAETHHAMNQRDALVGKVDEIMLKIRDRKMAIREIDDVLAQVKVNDRIDAQIAEAKALQKKYRQDSADAVKVLDQIKAVSMEKNRRLTDEVNSHFDIVRFKLFDQQNNGEFKDCCIPTIRNADGVYRVFGESANTALETRGQLDIISGLQKFYNTYVPVWLDGAECLDADNTKRIHMDTQLIMLSVSEGGLKIEGE